MVPRAVEVRRPRGRPRGGSVAETLRLLRRDSAPPNAPAAVPLQPGEMLPPLPPRFAYARQRTGFAVVDLTGQIDVIEPPMRNGLCMENGLL
jgi:hypothetical protein